MHHLTTFEQVAAVVIAVLSVARTARLVAQDSLPASAHLRVWVEAHLPARYAVLVKCQFCLTPWFAAGMAYWFYLADGHWTWWVINGIWGFSYVSAMLVSWDQPPELVVKVEQS